MPPLTHWGRDKWTPFRRRHVQDFKCIFVKENVWIPIEISLKFVPKGSINNNPALFQIMAWRRRGDKPVSEPIMVSSLTHICVTRPQWVNSSFLVLTETTILYSSLQFWWCVWHQIVTKPWSKLKPFMLPLRSHWTGLCGYWKCMLLYGKTKVIVCNVTAILAFGEMDLCCYIFKAYSAVFIFYWDSVVTFTLSVHPTCSYSVGGLLHL